MRRRGDAPKYLNNNHNQSLTLSSKPNKLLPLTSDISCRTRMTGQGKGAARILTEDPNFVMLDTSSPLQGQKRIGGTRTSSEEKRTKATSDKRGKSIPQEEEPACTSILARIQSHGEVGIRGKSTTHHRIMPNSEERTLRDRSI